MVYSRLKLSEGAENLEKMKSLVQTSKQKLKAKELKWEKTKV